MSFEKIAKILHVDEVNLMHGPKGVAVHVRIDKSWHTSTIDNDALGERRKEVIVEHLIHLADGHMHEIRKAFQGVDNATRAAVDAERRADARRRLSWNENTWVPYDIPIQQQIKRLKVDSAPQSAPPPAPEPAAIDSMPSRFHAIMAELGDL